MMKESAVLTSEHIRVMVRGNYTVGQAALYMGMRESTIRAMIHEKQIKINYVGSGLRISRAECDRVLMANSGFKL